MNVWRNKMWRDCYFKKVVIAIIGCNVLLLVLFGGLFYFTYQKSVQASNEVVQQLVANIRVEYSNISDEDILEVLNGTSETSFFADYGIDVRDTFAIANLRNSLQTFTLYFVIIWLFGITSILYCIFWYQRKNQKEIHGITKLIEDINHKIYTISLEDHREDLYSLLKSELYKTTIMLKEQAENSELEKEVLRVALSDISHQIKTPLTSILIMLDTITDYPDMSALQEKEFLEDIRSQVQRIHFLTMSILKLARLESGVIQFKNEKIVGEEFISSVLNNLDVLSVSKNISFVVSGSLVFYGDFRFLEEAFMNVLKNCIEASDMGGKIFIEMEENPLYSKFIIKDEGVGINQDELIHIFDRFFKSQNSSSDSIGIGLSLARKIIEGCYGRISCKSKVGEGTVFEIQFLKNR